MINFSIYSLFYKIINLNFKLFKMKNNSFVRSTMMIVYDNQKIWYSIKFTQKSSVLFSKKFTIRIRVL